MVNQPEARWADLERDLGLDRAEDLAWALGYASWGDPDISLARDMSTVTGLDLPLNQTWSVVFLACVLRGWLPDDEQASERIGAFLPSSESEEARSIQSLIGRIEASSDPRLELMPAISGSVWPRVDPRNALSWALSSEVADKLIAMPEVVRAFAQSTAGSVPPNGPLSPRTISKEDVDAFKSKSANALFTMFLALSYTAWGARELEDHEALLKHLKKLLEQRPADAHLDSFQLAVVREAEAMQEGQFSNILRNAEVMFTRKSKVMKAARAISLGRAQTP